MEWQPETFKWLNGNLDFSVNCYGESMVQFSNDIAS
jgi:hypothetical protein